MRCTDTTRGSPPSDFASLSNMALLPLLDSEAPISKLTELLLRMAPPPPCGMS